MGATVSVTDALTSAVRVVAKFGTDQATFAPATSTPAPPNQGDGVGSSSAAGTGGVILATPHTWSGSRFTTGNEGNVVTFRETDPYKAFDRVGDSVDAYNDFDRLIYQLNDQSLLSSFEGFLNISQLERSGYNVNPGPGDKFVLALQNNDKEYNDAFGHMPSGQNVTVPEPGGLALIVIGGATFGLAYRRRASRKPA